MGFLSSLLVILGFGIGIPLGLLVGFFLFIYSKPKEVEVNPFSSCSSLINLSVFCFLFV